MIKIIKLSLLLVFVLLLNSCASRYRKINPQTINYLSKNADGNILLEYKYDLLEKKYKKNETKNNIKLVAVKITNNTEKEVVLGRDFKLVYENGKEINLIETEKLFKTIKQSPASYLWYLLLSPIKFELKTTTSNNNGNPETDSQFSFPIGVILGPVLTFGNMIVAGNSNKNFKKELLDFDLYGKSIKIGETIYGLIGINSNGFDKIIIKR